MSDQLVIQSDARASGTPLRHVWSTCVGAGRANEGLRADWQQHLRRVVKECGFQYLRFHGLFHDDMFVYHEDNAGNPMYNWQYIDVLFDAMLEIGIRPFVEFGFSPKDLATEFGTCFWWKGHGSPPKDYDKWAALIAEFLRHCIARYGVDEVRQWYFEVWNEPNLHGFFTGTRSQYFELYRVTATAVKAIDPALRVGGPATSNFVADTRFDGDKEDPSAIGNKSFGKEADSLSWKPVWVEAFLAWCAEEKLPVDFISTHPYPTDFALDEHGTALGISRKKSAIVEDLHLLREIVRRSAYPDAEIHCTEWSSSPSPRDHTHDFPQAATYVVYSNLHGASAVDSLSYWVFTDVFEEGGAGDTVWHGGFGMINPQGLAKPTYHAYRFLHKLGVEVLTQGDGYIVTRHVDGRITVLLYHYPPEVLKSPPSSNTPEKAWETLRQGKRQPIDLRITGLPVDAPYVVETVDAQSGWARGVWEQLGCPEPPTREQVAYLHQASTPQVTPGVVGTDGTLTRSLLLNPWAIVLVDVLR